MLRSGTYESSRQTFKHVPALSKSSRLSVQDDSEFFTVSMEFSAFDEKSLDLWIEDHQLTVSADERSEFSFRSSPGFFLSCVDLPEDIDEETIQAELKSGRLSIRFAKDPSKPHSAF